MGSLLQDGGPSHDPYGVKVLATVSPFGLNINLKNAFDKPASGCSRKDRELIQPLLATYVFHEHMENWTLRQKAVYFARRYPHCNPFAPFPLESTNLFTDKWRDGQLQVDVSDIKEVYSEYKYKIRKKKRCL